MREWLVIESAAKHSVFADDGTGKEWEGYIPRDVVEIELGIRVDGTARTTWFSRHDGERMRAHPMWRTTPPGPNIHPALGFWYCGPDDAKAVKEPRATETSEMRETAAPPPAIADVQ